MRFDDSDDYNCHSHEDLCSASFAYTWTRFLFYFCDKSSNVATDWAKQGYSDWQFVSCDNSLQGTLLGQAPPNTFVMSHRNSRGSVAVNKPNHDACHTWSILFVKSWCFVTARSSSWYRALTNQTHTRWAAILYDAGQLDCPISGLGVCCVFVICCLPVVRSRQRRPN